MANRKVNGRLCHWCNRPMHQRGRDGLEATRDHVEPKSHGGTDQVWACRACNEIKANMTQKEWESFMSTNPQWWRIWDNIRGQGSIASQRRWYRQNAR